MATCLTAECPECGMRNAECGMETMPEIFRIPHSWRLPPGSGSNWYVRQYGTATGATGSARRARIPGWRNPARTRRSAPTSTQAPAGWRYSWQSFTPRPATTAHAVLRWEPSGRHSHTLTRYHLSFASGLTQAGPG